MPWSSELDAAPARQTHEWRPHGGAKGLSGRGPFAPRLQAGAPRSSAILTPVQGCRFARLPANVWLLQKGVSPSRLARLAAKESGPEERGAQVPGPSSHADTRPGWPRLRTPPRPECPPTLFFSLALQLALYSYIHSSNVRLWDSFLFLFYACSTRSS